MDYALLKILDDALKSGNIMHIDRFKRMVKEKIKVYENAQFQITYLLYKSIPLFNVCIGQIAMWPGWMFGEKSPEFISNIRNLY